MPYIGRGPSKSGAFRILKDFSASFDGSATSFAIQDTNGTALSVATPQNLMIAVDGVMQEPGSAYTISGTNIVFGSAPQDSASFWGVELGDIGGTSVSSSDQILVVATGHSFVVGRWMKATSTDGVYAYADCTTEANAEVAGVIISVTTDSYIIQVHGTVTGGAVPAQAGGTIMFLDDSNGQMTTTETSTVGEVSKPLAILTKNDSEMVILTYRGEVISSNVQTNAPNNATYVTTTANSTLTNEVLTSALKIDDFAAGDDNTDLDSSASRHGLLLKLGGGSTNFLRADGTWSAPGGGIASVVADTSPQLGGNLDMQARLLVGNGGSTGIAISANGEVTMAAQPAFAAHQSSNVLNVTGNGTAYTAVFPTEVYDQNSDFSSPTFTAPVTGKYVLTSSLRIFGNTTAISYGVISLVTSNRTWNVYTSCVSAGDTAGFFISAVADMDAADTCQVRLTIYGESSDLCDIAGSSSMSIHFAGILVA
tara:strand:- start:821 stop:2263 length:1443 start_codon:yes stop_codon:yes gene_type:complete